jgi:hypothetical protein
VNNKRDEKMQRRRQDPPTANRRRSLWRTMSTQGSASTGDTAKAIVAEQISQTVQSTSNLLHLMQHSSPAQVLSSLPQFHSKFKFKIHINNN